MECHCGAHRAAAAQLRPPLRRSSLPRRLPPLPSIRSLSFLSRPPYFASTLASSRVSGPSLRPSVPHLILSGDENLKGAVLSLLRPVSVALAVGAALFFARLHKPSLALALASPAHPAAELGADLRSTPSMEDSAPLTEEEKERTLEEYLDAQPEDTRALRALMRLKIRAKKPAEALNIVDRLILIEPREKSLPLLRAHLQSQGGNAEHAKQVFEGMLQKDPFFVEAYHGLVMAVSQSEGEGELASVLDRIQSAMEACGKEKRKEELRDFKLLVAQVKVIQGDYGGALKVYQALVKEDPRDFRPYLCQGIIYRLLGNKDEADKQIQKYRRLVPRGHPYSRYLDENLVAMDALSDLGRNKGTAAFKR